MSRRNQFPLFLVLLLLFSTIVALPHYHDNTADDHDCPLCLVSYHQHATSPSTGAFDGVPCFHETIVAASSPVFIENILIFFLHGRAPPA